MPSSVVKLVSEAQFRAVIEGSRGIAGRNFLVRALPNGAATARLGLIAGRKAARRAVDRNRGKRLAREMFRSMLDNMPALDVVIQQRTDLRKHGNTALRYELKTLLTTARTTGPR